MIESLCRYLALCDPLTRDCIRIVIDPSVRAVGDSPVKRAFRFRFYPDDALATELSKTFGCVRKVHDL
ncbi:helix-turn-helix domain-containing protein [Streptomyces sp. NPDC099050]|uniref:helix-turn-helix domain-containing protein n=1 Tax=Streptomyces sp. NPDC099050 TaxID=3366100 RepID=UPI00382D53B4